MILNSGKCHFICLGKNTENEMYLFINTEIKNSSDKKILGITTNNKLKFKSSVKNFCKKASQNIWALSRLTNHLNDSEKTLIFNAIIKSQFSYCSRQTNNMINKLHERALRLVLNDHVSDFETLLRKSNDVSSHHRNIQTLVIELYKIKNELAPPIMGEPSLTISEICKSFNQRERELFLMVWKP